MSNEPDTDTRLDGAGRFPCRCWCEAMIVQVTPADVRDGRTGSCGDGCHPGCPPRPPPKIGRPPRWPANATRRRNSAVRNPVRRDASEFGSAIVSGDNVKAPATGEVPGRGQSLLERNQRNAR